MANTLHISFLEMLLMKGMAAATEWFEDEGGKTWVYSSNAQRYVGKRNVKRALDKGVENGMIELDMSIGAPDEGDAAIRLTSLGEKLLKAAEPEVFELYKEHVKAAE